MTVLTAISIVIAIGLAIKYPKQAANTLIVIIMAIGLIFLGGFAGAGRSKARNVN